MPELPQTVQYHDEDSSVCIDTENLDDGSCYFLQAKIQSDPTYIRRFKQKTGALGQLIDRILVRKDNQQLVKALLSNGMRSF